MNIPRAEHPFPQMERGTWKNLNGEWQFEFDFGNSGIERKLFLEKSFSKKIVVPFCPESELSTIHYKDFMNGVWYKRDLPVTKEEKENRILLHFGAVDYECNVYVNGSHAGSHKGGYSSFCFDITEYIAAGDNDITVYARDNGRDGLQPRGKQSTLYHSNGCDYTRTTGIWQTVWVEFVPKTYIQKVKYYPNIKDGILHISGIANGGGRFCATAFYEGRECGRAEVNSVNGSFEADIKLSEIHLWELGKGRLYDLELYFNEDRVKSYFGLREAGLNNMKFCLNEKSVFQRLVLDQGFYQKGIYTAPAEEDLIKDIQLSMDMGFNGARLHEKVFEPRFLYHCDKMGYMVWGEMGNWGLDLSKYQALFSFLPEWMEVMERDFNHPSIVGWCPFNETWDYSGRQQINENLRIVYEYTKRADSTRPCIDTSGNYHVVTDIYDLHNYEQNVEKFSAYYEEFKNGGAIKEDHSHRQSYKEGLPVFISEYGGIQWEPGISYEGGWGYGKAPETEEEWLKRYEGLTTVLLDNPNIMGFCYTQLYDIEQEVNGLYYYSREPKFNQKTINIINGINTKKAAIED